MALTSFATVIALPAHAQQCPNLPDASPTVGRATAEQRLDYLRSVVPPARQKARRWYWSWTGSFTALTAGQLALIQLWDDEAQRRALWVNSASTTTGVLFLAVSPPGVMNLERRLARDGRLGQGPCEVVASWERQLVKAADAERFGKSWLAHGGNLLLNATAGMVLALGWNDWENAWMTTTAGALVGELMIWTQPMDVTRALARYRTGAWRAPAVAEHEALQLRIVPLYGGLGLRLEY